MRRALAALPLACLLLPLPAAAAPWIPPSGKLEMVVIRKGERIGKQVLTFKRDNGDLVVDADMKVNVKIAFVPVYRYAKKSQTVLRGPIMKGYSVEIDDNGQKSGFSIKSGSEDLILETGTEKKGLPEGTMVVSYWNVDMMSRRVLIDSDDGSLKLFSVESRTRETIALGDRTIEAWRYRLTGDLNSDVWYDDRGGFLRMQSKGRDGSTVVVERRL